jgi:hypothetical protein
MEEETIAKKMFSMGNSIKISVEKPTTKLQGVVQKDALQILGKRGCRRRAGVEKNGDAFLKEVTCPEGAVVPYVDGWNV